MSDMRRRTWTAACALALAVSCDPRCEEPPGPVDAGPQEVDERGSDHAHHRRVQPCRAAR